MLPKNYIKKNFNRWGTNYSCVYKNGQYVCSILFLITDQAKKFLNSLGNSFSFNQYVKHAIIALLPYAETAHHVGWPHFKKVFRYIHLSICLRYDFVKGNLYQRRTTKKFWVTEEDTCNVVTFSMNHLSYLVRLFSVHTIFTSEFRYRCTAYWIRCWPRVCLEQWTYHIQAWNCHLLLQGIQLHTSSS